METLTLQNLYNEIQADIPEIEESRFVIRAARRAAQHINSHFDGYPSYAEITLAADLTHSASAPESGLVFDSDDYTLTLPSHLKTLRALLVNGEKAINLGEGLGAADDYYFYYERLGERLLGVQSAWAAEGTVIAIRGLFYIGEISNTSTSLSLPKELKNLLYSGAVMNLAILPKFLNKDLYNHHKEIFYSGLASINESLANLTPQKQSAGPRYDYGGAL